MLGPKFIGPIIVISSIFTQGHTHGKNPHSNVTDCKSLPGLSFRGRRSGLAAGSITLLLRSGRFPKDEV